MGDRTSALRRFVDAKVGVACEGREVRVGVENLCICPDCDGSDQAVGRQSIAVHHLLAQFVIDVDGGARRTPTAHRHRHRPAWRGLDRSGIAAGLTCVGGQPRLLATSADCQMAAFIAFAVVRESTAELGFLRLGRSPTFADFCPGSASVATTPLPQRRPHRVRGRAGSAQRSTVTLRNVAGMMVRAGETLVFWAVNRSSSSALRSVALPVDSAAAKAFIVGP